jgi:hypothetical protein
VDFVGAHGDLIHWTAMVKHIDFTFLMKFTVRCTTSPWSPGEAGDSGCFCQDPDINGFIVINDKACRCNSNYETTKCFIVNSVSVYSKAIDVFENGKDKWYFCNFPFIYLSIQRIRIQYLFLSTAEGSITKRIAVTVRYQPTAPALI